MSRSDTTIPSFPSPSAMACETAEAPAVATRLIAMRGDLARVARSLDIGHVPFVVICGRGSSGHAGVYLRYLIETQLGLAVSAAAPSVSGVLKRPLRVKGALFIVISQSGGSPDLVEATQAARKAGAKTLAIVNVQDSPLARCAEYVLPIAAGPEHSIAATKSVIGAMLAGSELVACLAPKARLHAALDNMPDRLQQALALDWSILVHALAAAPCAYIAARGFGLGTAREIALKMAEVLRIPALAYSASELMHGPRAAISPATPVLALRQGDATRVAVDDLVANLRATGVPVHDCGGASGSLPWPGDHHPALDAVTMLVPAYLAIETAARTLGFDPDHPPHLSKITRTL
jgi:glutamine---fructose-6-phosphate transaminase (isomerizing)